MRTCPRGCSQKGRCEDGRCVCDPGYTGDDCGSRSCPWDCGEGGRCCLEGRCVCDDGYEGEDCGDGRCVGEDCGQEEPPASACPGGCGPRELCREGQCVCVEGFRGPDCAIQTCPGDCRGRGECQEGRCICQDGYAGEDCGEEAQEPGGRVKEEVPAIEGMRMHLLEETTVRTEWTRAPGNVDAYEIQFIPTTEGESPPFTARVPSSASAYDQRGLAPGQEYQVTVRALRGTNWGPPASKTITTMIDGPQDLRVVAVTPTTLELNWMRPQAEVDRFVVSYVSAGNQRVRLEVPPEADGTLLTGLMPGVEYVVTVTAERGQAPPAEAPSGELTVPGTSRTVSLPDLRPGTTYHVEVHGVRAGQTSKSYAFITTTGLLGATDEPPPSGPSTTQGAQAPVLQQRPQELGELRLHLRVPEGPGAHEERLPGDVHQALVPSPPPGSPYELSLRGVPPEGEPSAPLIYQGIMGTSWILPKTSVLRDGEKPGKPLAPPRLGKLSVTDVTSNSLLLHWTVLEGEFDSFMIQYKDRDGPQVVPVEGPQRSALISNLDVGRKYKFVLYGLVGKKKHGPLVTEAKILAQTDPSPGTPPRLGMLWVTDPTPDSLHLSWTVPEGQFDSFVVQYRDRDGRPQVVPVEGPERSVVVSPLDPDHKYRFTLFGIANRKRHGPLTAEGTTGPASLLRTAGPLSSCAAAPQGPEAPEKREEPRHPESPQQPLLGELAVTGATPDSLHLSWTVAQGSFDSFTVQYKDAQGRPQVVPVRGEENEVTIPGLESDRKYKMNLYGLHGRQRVGPVSVVATTALQEIVDETPSPAEVEETPSPTEPSTEAPEPPEEPLLGEMTHRDRDGQPKVMRVPGHEDGVTVSGLEPDHKYKMNLYGFHNGQRLGPVSVIGVTIPVDRPGQRRTSVSCAAAEEETPSPTEMEETPSPTEPSTEAPESPEEPLLGELTGHFDSFTVQYKGRDGPQVVRVGGEESEVTVGDLEPGRKYKMHLYGLHGGRRVGPVSTVGVTAPQPEETPPATEPPLEPRLGELTVTDVTPNSVGLAWTVPEGQFDSFVVQYKDRDGQPQAVPVAADQREVTVLGLEPARKYKMNFYGLHGGRRVGPLAVVAVTAPATEHPLEPRLGELTVTDVTPDSVGLSWTVPEGKFDSFVVQYKDRDGQPQVVPVASDQREVTVPGLEPSRKYKFLLFGILDGKRHSPVSVEAKTDSLRLSWTVPEGHFDSFVVQFKDRDGPQVVPVEGHERSVTVAPLDANRKYKFLLYGLLGKKRHGPLSAEGTTGTQSAVDEARTKHPSKPRLGEELQYKDRDGQPQVVPVDGSLREVSISGLDPARRYKLLLYGLHKGRRVGPISAITETAPKEEMEAETEAPSPPASEPHLGEVTVEEATPHTLRLSWMVTEGEFDSFEVQYTDEDGQLQVVRLGGDQNDITLSDLESDHKYLVSLYGFHNGQSVGPVHVEALTAPREEEDEPSESPSTTPEPPIKPRLGELAVTDTSPDSLSLSWTIPEGQFDHFLVQYKNGDGQPKAVRVPGHEDGVTVSGLEPDHKYKMNLYGFHDGQRLGPVSVIGVTKKDLPAEEETPSPTEMEETPSPTEPSTEAPEPPEEPLLGELTGHFDSFTVQYKGRDGPQVVRVGGEESEVTVGGLEPGRKYKMHLYGLHGGQRMGPVSTVGVTAPEEEPPASPPLKPYLGDLTVTDATPDSLSLSWTVPEGQFDHFLVQYKNGNGQPKAVRVPGHQDGVTVSGLEPDHKYKMNLYGFHEGQRLGPVSTIGLTAPRKDLEMTPAPTDLPTEPPIKPRLGELAVTDTSPDSLSLSWTIPEGQFDHFLVQYKNGDGQPKAVRVPGHEDGVTVSGLEPDHKYKMNLYGFHDGQRLGPVSVIGVTIPADRPGQKRTSVSCAAAEEETPSPTEPSTEAPESPEEPLLGELTGHFDSFTVQYKGRDGPQVVRVGGEESEVTVGGLEPGRKYKMHLYGLHGGRRVGPVSTVGVTAPQDVVAAEEETPSPTEMEETPSPTEPSTEAPESPEEPLLGELTGHFDSFTVQYKGRDGPQVVRVGGEESEVTVGGLEPGRKYKMHLYGLHGGRRVGPVSTVGVTAPDYEAMTTQAPPTEAPEPPIKPRLGELAVTDASPDSLSLSWTVPEGQFDHFLVQYKNGDGQPKAVRVPGHEDGVTVSGLEPDHKYKMNLYGFHDGQRLGPVSVIGVTKKDLSAEEETPSPTEMEETPSPTEPSTEAPESPEEPLLGELTGHFDSFTVQYKGRDGPQVVRVGGEESEVTVGGLEPGRKYKMHLYGLHGGRRVGPVSTVGVTASLTTEPPLPPQLRELTVAAVGSDTVRLLWTVAQGLFDSFLVQYKDVQGQPQAVPVGGDLREVTVSGLAPARKYKFLLFGLQDEKRHGPVSADAKTHLFIYWVQ
ncbi:tenascin-X [Camelus ferus]|nr:tenascin-X [Camelus ferus]